MRQPLKDHQSRGKWKDSAREIFFWWHPEMEGWHFSWQWLWRCGNLFFHSISVSIPVLTVTWDWFILSFLNNSQVQQATVKTVLIPAPFTIFLPKNTDLEQLGPFPMMQRHNHCDNEVMSRAFSDKKLNYVQLSSSWPLVKESTGDEMTSSSLFSQTIDKCTC